MTNTGAESWKKRKVEKETVSLLIQNLTVTEENCSNDSEMGEDGGGNNGDGQEPPQSEASWHL